MKKVICMLMSLIFVFTITGCGKKPVHDKKPSNHIKKVKKSKNNKPLSVKDKTYKPVSIKIPVITSMTKVAYLTFDDGPSGNVTPKLLDILKKNNVKATFFLIGKAAKKYPNLVRRIYYEGHALGNHSYSHKYNYIYSSWPNLWGEISKTNDIIFKATGQKCSLFRAPGGSKPLMPDSFIYNIHANGMKLFDWNCVTGDGLSNKYSVDQLYNNFLASSYHNHLFILVHCRDDNYNSMLTVPRIIKNLKQRGYIFLPINKSTKEILFTH